MGYTGGSRENPTYHALGDHTETLELDFDPAVITFAQLMERYFKSHDPASTSWGRQYRSVVFYHDEAQRRVVEEAKTQRIGKAVSGGTAIEPAKTFYRAEDYHQKYYLRQSRELVAKLRRALPSEREFVDSTLAARLNGYEGGHGTAEDIRREMAVEGFPADWQKAVVGDLAANR